ncbi:MAG: potassium channel family protein, partial [Chloroflexia bacterium]
MFVVIAGGGPTGAQLASALLAQGHRVCVVEHRGDILPRLHGLLPTEAIYEGHALDLEVLDRLPLRRAQVLAACLPADTDNLVLCYVARARYGVPRTIARINNPHAAWLFSRAFCVDVAVNQAEILAGLIAEEMSLGEMVTLLKLRRGQLALVEQR